MQIQGYVPAGKLLSFHQVPRHEPAAIPPAAVQDCMGRMALFSNLPAPGRRQLISAGRIASFRRREVVFAPGDPADHVILLTAGCVKTQQDTRNGNAVILRLNAPGDLLDADRLEGARYHRFTSFALSPCKALVWNGAVFNGFTNRFFVLQANLSRLINDYLTDLEKRYCEMATETTYARLGHEIFRLARQIGEESSGAIRIRISQEDLAQLTGTTLYTVSRILSLWKEEGAVATGREYIEVLNPRKLAEICESK